MTTFINLFGGPGVGKSTTAAAVFFDMKVKGYAVELVTEVAKDFVWENRLDTLMIQPYVTMKQYRNLARLIGKVDYVITDAPVLIGILYGSKYPQILPPSYNQFVRDCHTNILSPSINIMLERSHAYDPVGRYQTEREAIDIDRELAEILSSTNMDVLHSLPSAVPDLVDSIIKQGR